MEITRAKDTKERILMAAPDVFPKKNRRVSLYMLLWFYSNAQFP